jgi:thiamine pyrophosphate-dependent acetolactate synthase large subunit-like protein
VLEQQLLQRLARSFVAQIDVDATSIGRVLPVDLSIVCDAESFLANLLDARGGRSDAQ